MSPKTTKKKIVKKSEIHVLPWCDGSTYKNGKPRTKWIVVENPKVNFPPIKGEEIK